MRDRLTTHLRVPALSLAYGLLWLGLYLISQAYWFLPAGLRFGAFLLAPRKLWLWLIGAEWVAALLMHLWIRPLPDISIVLWATLPPPLIVAGIIAVMRRNKFTLQLWPPEHLGQLLLTALMATTAVTLANTPVLGPISRLIISNRPIALANIMLGDYLGILLIAPVLVLLLRAPPDEHDSKQLLFDIAAFLLPVIFSILLLLNYGLPLGRYATVLTLIPVIYIAFRHGWRGASLALLASSAAITLRTGLDVRANQPAAAQLFLAVAGTGALLLGAATDALRQSGTRLARQNKLLEEANLRLDQLSHRLARAARGNLRKEEYDRRRIASELHDELSQNLTAIQIQIKLEQPRLEQVGLIDIANSVNQLIQRMRHSVRHLLDTLQPSVLSEFGLARALEEGPIRALVRSSGMAYHLHISGDLRTLDDDMRTAIYRIIQEAATNAVRHARANRFTVRLRVACHGNRILALVKLIDNGIGLAAQPTREKGRGLTGMRDRVLALGGTMHLRTHHGGLQIHVLLQQPLSDE